MYVTPKCITMLTEVGMHRKLQLRRSNSGGPSVISWLGYPYEGVSWFPSVPAECYKSPSNSAMNASFHVSSTHQSLANLQFDVIQSDVCKALLNQQIYRYSLS
jgi:hypothetical protein